MRAGTTVLRWGRQLIAAVAILAVTGGVALGAPPQNRPSEPDKKKQPPPDSDSKKDKADDKGENDEAKGESGSSGSDKRGRKPRTRPAPKGKSPRDKNPKKPGSDDEAADKEPAQEGANKPVEIPPDVQRQIDELMAKEAAGGGKRKPTDGVVTPPSGRKPPVHRATDRPRPTSRKSRSSGRAEPTTADDESNADPRRGGRTPRSTPGSTPPRRTGAESSTKIEIPAVEGEDLPAEERVYEFAIKNGTFEQLLEGVARQTGLGMQGDAPRDERVSFVTEERLNFEEMLSRVRMLLFNYKPHEPYWLLREKTHLKVIRVNDMYRDLEPTQIFRSVEDYRAANLRDEEIAMVIYTPSAGSIARLNIVRDFMPDYVRVAQIAESNSVTIFALVRDINKYFELVNIFIPEDGDDDPRSLEVIEVQHLVPTDAWTKIETLMDLESDGKRTGGSRSRRKQPTGAIEGIEELSVSVVPDDARGVLIVRAMADKIAEIKKLLPVVDVPAGVDYPPVIVPLTHLDAEEIVPMIEQLLAASAGDASPAAAPIKSARRGKRRRSGGSPDAVTANDVVLLPHPMGDSIIVIGSEEDVATVREYVKLLDRLGLRGPELIAVNYTDPTELVAVITQLVANDGGGAKSTPRFSVVPDPGGTGIWFTGPQKDYEKVIEIVTAIDVQEGHDKLHVIRLENQLPSFVVSILEQYDSSDSAGAAAATSSKRGRRRRAPKPKAGASAVGKFTADDENMRLFVFCTDEEWQGYLEIIKQLEEQIDPDGPPFVLLAVEHVDPAAAMEKLKTLVVGKSVGRRGAQQAKEEIRFEVSDTDIIVTGAAPEEIDLMRDLLAVFDMPLDEEIVERIFEFKHVDTEHMVGAIQALISSSTTDPKRRMPRTAGKAAAAAGDEGLTIVTVGNRTVVRTTPENMDRIVALVQEFDVPDEENTLRVYDDFPPTADIQAIADTLTAMLAPGAQRRVPKQASAEESQLHIIAQPDVGRIVVLAPPSQFAEIEELLEVLRVGGDITSIETAFAEVHFADPDEVVALVQPMLSMKVAEFVAQGLLQGAPEPITIATAPGKQPARPRRDGHSDNWFHLAPDHRHRRVVIAAPQIVIDEAKELVAQFDYRGPESELVTRTVELENATANEMARIIREMMSGTMRRDTRPRRQPADPAGANTLDDEFGIFEAPGGMAVVLRGSQELVDQANEWVSELDALQTRDRDVKVYTLKVASPKRMVDILMATLDTPQPTQRAQKRPVRSSHRGGFDVEEDDEPEWETEIKRHGTDLFIMADTISRTLTISAPPAKLARADELVAEFDQEDVPGTQPKPMVPRFTYELEYADAFDASFELDMVIDAMWSYEEKPRVESAMFGGDVLIIEYPDESKFPEIVELIEKYVDKRPENADEDIRTIVPVPEGMTADEVARWITNKYADIDIELVNRTKRSEEDFDVDRVRPRSPSNVNPCALPTIGRLAATGLLVETLAIALPTVQTSPDEQPDEKQEDEPPPPPDDTQPEEDAEPIDDSAGDVDVPPDDDVLQSFTREVLDTPKDQSEDRKKKGKSSGRPLRTSDQPRGKLRVIIDSETGEVILEGRPDVVNDVEETYEEYLEEEGAGREGPPDIRIYRVKYIDVFTATDIIEEMFNATRQQRAQVQQQQRLAQQRARQQQRQQQQQQRQQQQQGKSGQQDPQGRGQQQQQQQQQVPQLPPTNVRVYPNPRDRTLILRADASQYPALLELLATIDQPQPIERKFKTFRLEKLNAVEVEEMLSGMLGLDEAGSGSQRRSGSSRRSSARRTPGAGIDPGSPLPVNIMAGKADGTGVLGVDPEDISISSNEEANTILVMAPQEAIDYIGDLIEQFENYEVPERIWKNYKLQHANAGDVVEYLLSYFEEATTTPGVATRGRPSRGRSPSGAPSLNSPTVVAYERLNLVSVQATEEQIVEVDDIVARLDVRGEVDNWQSQTLTRADAAHVADTLTQMFGGGAAVRGPRGKPATTGPGPSFIGEEGGRVLFYAAPENLQEDILAVIEQIESETESEAKPHVITLVHAEPSAIATALEPVYGQRRQRRMGRGGAVGAAPEFSVSAHDASNRLFVVTDDETFTQVESLVRTMDVPATVDFDFRIYPLRFADAKKVHGQMKKLITDYMRQLGVGRGGTSEPFSVEVDEKTNALVVLGGPAVFGFLEENLAKIDIPANARSPKGTMIVTLESADAQEVAQTINQLWSGRDLPEGETPPQAQANRTTNTLVVRGNQEQLDEIKKEFVDKIEEQKSLQLLTETITLAHADPEAVAESINRIFDDKRDAMLRLGRDSNVSPVEFTVVATPDFATKQIIVQASESNLDLIKARVAELDKPENADAGVTMQIYPIKHADPNAVVGIIKEWARSRTQDRPGGRVSPGDIITATAEPQTQTVVVTASAANHLIVKEMIDGLDSDSVVAAGTRTQHTIPLQHASADELAQQLMQLYRQMPRRRGDVGPGFVGDPNSNALMVVATQDELQELQALVQSLDVEAELERKQQLKSFRLEAGDPWAVQDAINRMFPPGRDPRDRVTAVAEGGSNSVVVAASPENMARVEELISQLDLADGVQKDVYVINLKNADADQVARTLNEIFVQSLPRTRGQSAPPISISALSGSRAILVKCNADDYAEIAEAVTALDSEETIGDEVRVVTLQYGDATEMQQALQETISKPGTRGGRGGELIGDARIAALPSSNAIVITGTADIVEKLEAKVIQLDNVGREGALPKAIPLQHARLSQVMPKLKDMFVDQRGNRRGQEPVVITGDDVTNAVIVRASPTEFAAINAVVEQLDTEVAGNTKNYRIVQVSPGVNLDQLAEQVEIAVNNRPTDGGSRRGSSNEPEVTILADSRTHSLTISGSPALFDDAEQLIKEYEQMGPMGGRATAVVQVQNRAVEDIQRLIDQLTQTGGGGGSDRARRSGRDSSRRRSPATRPSSRRPSTNRRR